MSSSPDIAYSALIPGITRTRFSAVVVLNPPSPPGYFANRDSHGGYGQLYPSGATIMPPLDVPYLVAYLEEKKVPVEVIEAQGLGLKCLHWRLWLCRRPRAPSHLQGDLR